MTLKRLLFSATLPTVMMGLSAPALAQTTIDTPTTIPLQTSTSGDITIAGGGDVTVESGTAIIIDSDNIVTNDGTIGSNNADNVTGIDLQGGNTGSFTNNGAINLVEDFAPTDTDGDGIVDGGVAEGTGRTGILISGASPFVGNVEFGNTGAVTVEGNDSSGIRLAENSTFMGNIDLRNLTVTGANAIGADIAGQVIGTLALGGSLVTQGENASAINVSGDVSGGIVTNATITNTGFRFTQRPPLNGRNLLSEEDLLQAGSAIQVSGNLGQGLHLQQVMEPSFDADGNPVLNADGNPVITTVAVSNITQFGSAPAVLIDGSGTPIALGQVSAIIDPNAEGFDEDLLYAFVNQGVLTASGVYDDLNATAFEVRDATLSGGFNNSSSITAQTFRSGNDATPDDPDATGLARVIVIGDGAIAERINNTGVILATVSEATDEIFADRDNIIPPRMVTATAIDIEANGNLASITNTNSISAIVTGRNGTAVAIQDASGTVTEINNTGFIQAAGTSSDTQGLVDTEFNVIAIDLSANTSGITINQTPSIDPNPDDSIDPFNPLIRGDVLLGSGDDAFNVSAGIVGGNLEFGDGADSFTLTGNSEYSGILTDTDGNLALSVASGSSLTLSNADPVNITSAEFDGTSTFSPTLNGATGQASTLVASNDITFADGATITPVLNNIVGTTNTTYSIAQAGGTLDVGALNFADEGETPFLYETSFAIDPNDPNTLLVTLDLRSTDDLGLDRVQSASFTSAFEALQNNSGLANSIINIQDGTEFNQAINQLLPEFTASSRQFILANVDGAVGAVGTHLSSARRSPDRTGGAWLEHFAYYADRDLAGLSEQYRGSGFGFASGIDTAIGPFHAVGVNVGFASTEIEDVLGSDDPINIVTLQAGLYAGFERGNLGIDGYVGGGYNDYESNRVVNIGTFTDSAQGNWSGYHYNASLRAGYDFEFSDRFWARPEVSADYLSLNENAYTETGATGVALSIDDRTTDVGSVTAMINLGARFQGNRTWIRPAIRAGYRSEFISDGVITTGRFAGLTTPFEIESEAFPDNGFLLGFTVAAGSAYSSFALDFDSDIRDGFIRHTGRVVVRLLF